MNGFTIIDKNSDYYIKRNIAGLIEYAEMNLIDPATGKFFKAKDYEVSIKPVYSATFEDAAYNLITNSANESPDSLLLFIGNSFSVIGRLYSQLNFDFTFRNMIYKVPFILRNPMQDLTYQIHGFTEGAYIYGKFVRITRVNKTIPIVHFNLGNNDIQKSND